MSAYRGSILNLALLLMLSACSVRSNNPEVARPQLSPAQQRESTLNTVWRNRPYSALVKALGAPSMTAQYPGNSFKLVAVYGIVDRKSECIDSFVLQSGYDGEAMVLEYFCR